MISLLSTTQLAAAIRSPSSSLPSFSRPLFTSLLRRDQTSNHGLIDNSPTRAFFHKEAAPKHDGYQNFRFSPQYEAAAPQAPNFSPRSRPDGTSSGSGGDESFGPGNASPRNYYASAPSHPSSQMPRLNRRFPIINLQMVSHLNLQIESFMTTEFQTRARWSLLLFIPGCFSKVCSTEINKFSESINQFKAYDCQIIGITVAHPDVVAKWMSTPRDKGGVDGSKISIVCDTSHRMTKYCNFFNFSSSSPFRSSVIINNEGFFKHFSSNLSPIGRDVQSTLRNVAALDYLNQNESHSLPVDWKVGDEGLENSRITQ